MGKLQRKKKSKVPVSYTHLKLKEEEKTESIQRKETYEAKVKEAPKAVKDPLRVVKGKDLTEDTVLAKKGVENSNKMPRCV